MKTFENEWLLAPLARKPGFRTRRMFGGLAAYLGDRILLVLVEPTKSGRWKWHGVLVATDKQRHPAILVQFPQFAPHEFLKKWLYLDSHHEEFEETMEHVTRLMARGDPRFGVLTDA